MSIQKRHDCLCLFLSLAIGIWTLSLGVYPALGHDPHVNATIGDRPVLPGHLKQKEITSGRLDLKQILERGNILFDAKFNTLDGQGRPAATGSGDPTSRIPDQPNFIRTSSPDSNSCAGCHNQPRSGGGGDFVANVFVLAQTVDPVTHSVSPEFSDERNTLGMMGSGPIEMLGREMTADLMEIRRAALAQAAASGQSVSRSLNTKGVNFGSITAHPDGSVDLSGIEGVDSDLIIKPFHQKGVVRSIREFTVNAMNHHHGMQAVERFGAERTGSRDFDQDGIEDELSVGDITSVTIFQAALGTPGRVIPAGRQAAKAALRGERQFVQIGCADCHRPQLELESPLFCEPNPLNPPGTFNNASASFCFDMTMQGESPRLERLADGRIMVAAFTDLKRHRICDESLPHFCNEKLVQGGVPTDQFITRKLWDVGSSAPYGHRGDLTTITEAILAHGGEARQERDRFAALSPAKQAELVEFLKSLQILPPDGE